MVSYLKENVKDLFDIPEEDKENLRPYQRKFINNINLAKSYITEHNYQHLLKYIENATTIKISICQRISFAEGKDRIKSYTSILTSVIDNPYITFNSFNKEPQIIINDDHIPTMNINLTCISDFLITGIDDNHLQLFFNYGEDGYTNMFIINIKCD